MKRVNAIQKISVEIPTVSTDKEGHLLGGFSAFGVTARGSNNSGCPDNTGVCNNNSMCRNNQGCMDNGGCSDNKSCLNNTSCSQNKDACTGNKTCNNTKCSSTDDTTESSAKSFLLGGSMLF